MNPPDRRRPADGSPASTRASAPASRGDPAARSVGAVDLRRRRRASGQSSPIAATPAPRLGVEPMDGASASQTGTPASAKIPAVVDLPMPIEPVSPRSERTRSCRQNRGARRRIDVRRRPEPALEPRRRLMQQHAEPVDHLAAALGRGFQERRASAACRPDRSPSRRRARARRATTGIGLARHPERRRVHDGRGIRRAWPLPCPSRTPTTPRPKSAAQRLGALPGSVGDPDLRARHLQKRGHDAARAPPPAPRTIARAGIGRPVRRVLAADCR